MTIQKISGADIEQAKKHFSKLPKKQPPSKLVGDALEELKPSILELIEKGYTKDDVIDELSKIGINIKRYRLKVLLGGGLQDSAKKGMSHSPASE